MHDTIQQKMLDKKHRWEGCILWQIHITNQIKKQ